MLMNLKLNYSAGVEERKSQKQEAVEKNVRKVEEKNVPMIHDLSDPFYLSVAFILFPV